MPTLPLKPAPLILASTSPHRRALLARLGVAFEVAAPAYDEPGLPGLTPGELALAHALAKARDVSRRHPDRIVIGSDQVAEVDGGILGKPGSQEAAVAQLARMAGKRVGFYTGLAVLRGAQEQAWVEPFWVRIRGLARSQIEAYVAREKPLECAGSFRIEGLGIALMEGLEGRDPTALIGLPLIALTEMLIRFGVDVLTDPEATKNGMPSSAPER